MVRRLLALVMGAALLVALLVTVDPVADAAAPVSVRGRVTDLGGFPLANIEVHVVQYDRLGAYSIARGWTDDAGRYRFTFSGAEVIGSSPSVVARSWDFAGPRRAVGSLPGRTYTVDLALRRLPRITGRVVDRAGDPIEQAEVSLLNTAPGGDCPGGVDRRGDSSDCLDWNYYGASGAVTNSDGRFSVTIRNGEEFSAVVRVRPVGGLRHKTTAVHGIEAGDHVEIVMRGGDPAVEPVAVAGVVTDESGEPVAGVEVAAVDPDTTREDAHGTDDVTLAVATTDEVGRYQLSFDPLAVDNLEKRIHVRVATPDGIVEWPVGDAAYYEPGSTVTADIALGPPGIVSGTVLDADGNPLAGAEVCCGLGGASTLTGSGGAFSLAAPAGFGTLVVDDSPLSTTDYVVPPGATVDVDIQLRRPPEIEPEPPAPEPDVTRPAPPQQVTATVLGPHRVRVRFRPAYSGGLPITAFRAVCVGSRAALNRAVRGEHAPLVVARLVPDRRYRCKVRGRNDLGWGVWSAYTAGFRTPQG